MTSATMMLVPVTEPPEVPCPTAEVTRPGNRPEPPLLDPALSTVGGPALATSGLVVPPAAPPVPDGITATSWLVADLDSGAVLGGCGPHEYGVPASVQKLLLAATLLPELDPAEVVEVTEADLDFESGSSAVGLLAGGEYSVATLWLGLLLSSGNDAANVLARIGGGEAGVAGTIRAMNEFAHWLGAYQTHAVTPSGLDGPGQFTSAYDLALIARVCFDLADFREYVLTRTADIPAQPSLDSHGFQIQNQNLLLDQYPGALGGKTGFTTLARHSYVGAAERDGRRLVVTLLGAEVMPLRGWQQGAALLDWGFSLPADAEVGRLVDAAELAQVAVSSTRRPTPPTGWSALVPVAGPAELAAAGVAVVSLLALGLVSVRLWYRRG